MATWRIHKRYGRGVARVVLSASPYRADLDALSLTAAMRLAGPDALRAARSGMLVVSILAFALLVTVSRDRHDVSNSRIFVFRDAPSVPLLPVSEPLVSPPVVPPEPPIAKAKPPKPPAPPVVDVPPEPRRLAMVEATPPPPPARPRRVEREPAPRPRARPPERKRPRIELAAIAPKPRPPSPSPSAGRQARPQRPDASRKSRPTPLLTVAGLDAAAPDLGERATSRRTPTRKSPERTSRASLQGLAATKALPEPFRPAETRAGRTTQRQFASVRGPARSRVDLQPTHGRSPLPQEPASHQPQSRRSARTRSVQKRAARSPSRVALAPAALAPAGTPAAASSLPGARRAERSSAPRNASQSRSQGTGLRAVPLGDLASCVSDREEALLKQRVLAAVTSRVQCASSAGTYRFVETRNLNSFLMWIEPAPGQTASDRCAELNNALACLESIL